jgi:hypothetical protein
MQLVEALPRLGARSYLWLRPQPEAIMVESETRFAVAAWPEAADLAAICFQIRTAASEPLSALAIAAAGGGTSGAHCSVPHSASGVDTGDAGVYIKDSFARARPLNQNQSRATSFPLFSLHGFR